MTESDHKRSGIGVNYAGQEKPVTGESLICIWTYMHINAFEIEDESCWIIVQLNEGLFVKHAQKL